MPGRPDLAGQRVAAGEARGGSMQAAALGDDHGHDEPPNGRAGRERMTEALDAVVAADDQAGTERAAALEFGRDARLQVEVALAGSPGAQRRLERACGIDCERREALLLGGLEGKAQAGERVSGVDAEARMPITRQRRRRAAGELPRGCHQACVALEPLDRLQRAGRAPRDRARRRYAEPRRSWSERARRRA